MKKFAVLGLVLSVLGGAASQGQAHGWGSCCPPPCCPPRVCYRMECVPVNCTVQVPRCVMVERNVRVCIPVCTWVDREVCCVRYVPVQCVDNCGCCYTCMRPETYTTTVRCPVYSHRFEDRTVMCPTVVYEPRVIVRHVYRCVAVPCCDSPMPPAN